MIDLHGTNFLSRLVSALGLIFAHADKRLHATSVGDSLVGLRHGCDGSELFHHFVVAEGALDAHSRLARSHSAVLSLEQLDLFVEQILWELIAAEGTKRNQLLKSVFDFRKVPLTSCFVGFASSARDCCAWWSLSWWASDAGALRLPGTLLAVGCSVAAAVDTRNCDCSHHRPCARTKAHPRYHSRRGGCRSHADVRSRTTTDSRSGICRSKRCYRWEEDGRLSAASWKREEKETQLDKRFFSFLELKRKSELKSVRMSSRTTFDFRCITNWAGFGGEKVSR